MEGHNTWIANHPGSLLVIPVADIAQHNIANLCFFTQNGYCVYDDVNRRPIPGMDAFRGLVDVDDPLPLTFLEQYSVTEATAELACAAFSGVLMLQAMGLGGWMFDGIDRHTMLGASGDPDVPGLGFRFDHDEERYPLPNPTGLDGVFEAFCPPHHADMAAAVEAFAERKFGPGGVYNPETPGAWKESDRIRGAAQPYSDEFKACVAHQSQYIYDTFGKFPGTVPTLFIMNYVQAQHIDLDFYDRFFRPGAVPADPRRAHGRLALTGIEHVNPPGLYPGAPYHYAAVAGRRPDGVRGRRLPDRRGRGRRPRRHRGPGAEGGREPVRRTVGGRCRSRGRPEDDRLRRLLRAARPRPGLGGHRRRLRPGPPAEHAARRRRSGLHRPAGRDRGDRRPG